MSTVAALKNLRQRVWDKSKPLDADAIGEALRDLYAFCEQLTAVEVVPISEAIWSEPFSFELERAPVLVTLSDVRLAGSTAAVDPGPIEWLVDSGATTRVRIVSAAKLVPGTKYNLKFVVTYA